MKIVKTMNQIKTAAQAAIQTPAAPGGGKVKAVKAAVFVTSGPQTTIPAPATTVPALQTTTPAPPPTAVSPPAPSLHTGKRRF